MAPFNEVLSLEDILVIGAAPYEDERFNSHRIHRPTYDSGGGGNLYYGASFDGLWGNEERLGGVSIGKFRWGNRSGWTAPIDLYCHIFSRCIAAVFPSWLHSEARDYELGVGAIPFRFALRAHSADALHISRLRRVSAGRQFVIEPIEKDESAFGSLENSLPGLSQLIGCDPQSEGESSDRDTSQCSEKAVVPIDKVNRAYDLSPDDADDDWAFFLSFLIAVTDGILTYASLKLGCDLIFGKDK